MQKFRSVVLAGLFVAVGCGEDDADTGGSASGAALCERICSQAASKQCGDVTEQECESSCMEQEAETPAECKGTADAFLRCAAKAKYDCDRDTGDAVAIGCLDELEDLQTCFLQHATDGETESDAGTRPQPMPADSGRPTTGGDAGSAPNACVPSAADDACDTCTLKSCCSELGACQADTGCSAISSCLSQCDTDDDACQQSCVVGASPRSLTLFSATLSCFGQHCAAQCGTDTNEPSEPGQDDNCLPTGVPEGYCTDPTHPVGHECVVAPAGDCIPLENVSDVYCCAS